MYKITVKFNDFDEPPKEQEMTCYFALNEANFLELQADLGGHVQERVRLIREKKDEAALIELIKRLMRASYGERSPDKLRLIRDDAAWSRFHDSNAYSAVLMKILKDDKENAAFLRGILPESISAEAGEEIDKLISEYKTSQAS